MDGGVQQSSSGPVSASFQESPRKEESHQIFYLIFFTCFNCNMILAYKVRWKNCVKRTNILFIIHHSCQAISKVGDVVFVEATETHTPITGHHVDMERCEVMTLGRRQS